MRDDERAEALPRRFQGLDRDPASQREHALLADEEAQDPARPVVPLHAGRSRRAAPAGSQATPIAPSPGQPPAARKAAGKVPNPRPE
jgi:hypothetical protein